MAKRRRVSHRAGAAASSSKVISSPPSLPSSSPISNVDVDVDDEIPLANLSSSSSSSSPSPSSSSSSFPNTKLKKIPKSHKGSKSKKESMNISPSVSEMEYNDNDDDNHHEGEEDSTDKPLLLSPSKVIPVSITLSSPSFSSSSDHSKTNSLINENCNPSPMVDVDDGNHDDNNHDFIDIHSSSSLSLTLSTTNLSKGRGKGRQKRKISTPLEESKEDGEKDKSAVEEKKNENDQEILREKEKEKNGVADDDADVIICLSPSQSPSHSSHPLHSSSSSHFSSPSPSSSLAPIFSIPSATLSSTHHSSSSALSSSILSSVKGKSSGMKNAEKSKDKEKEKRKDHSHPIEITSGSSSSSPSPPLPSSSSSPSSSDPSDYISCPVCSCTIARHFLNWHLDECLAKNSNNNTKKKEKSYISFVDLPIPTASSAIPSTSTYAMKKEKEKEKDKGKEKEKSSGKHHHAIEIDGRAPPSSSSFPSSPPPSSSSSSSPIFLMEDVDSDVSIVTSARPIASLSASSPSPPLSSSASSVWSQLLPSHPSVPYHFVLSLSFNSDSSLSSFSPFFRPHCTPSPTDVKVLSRVPCPKNVILNTQKMPKDIHISLYCNGNMEEGIGEGVEKGNSLSTMQINHPSYLPADLNVPPSTDSNVNFPSSSSSPSSISFDFSPSHLKSLLQKNVRLSRPFSAVRVAIQLIRTSGITEALRRISIIVIEDCIIHPLYPVMIYLLCITSYWKEIEKSHSSDSVIRKIFNFTPLLSSSSSASISLTPPIWILNFLLNFVFEISSCSVKDFIPNDVGDSETIREMENNKEDGKFPLLALPPLEMSLVISLLLRESFGGMDGDKQMLKTFAMVWTKRFMAAKNITKGKGEAGGERGADGMNQNINNNNNNNIPLSLSSTLSMNWISFITDVIMKSASQHFQQSNTKFPSIPTSKKSPLAVSSLCKIFSFLPSSTLFSLSRGDIPLSAIDQHCSDIIAKLLSHPAVLDDLAYLHQISQQIKGLKELDKIKEIIDNCPLSSNGFHSASSALTHPRPPIPSASDCDGLLSRIIWHCRSSVTNKIILNKANVNSNSISLLANDVSSSSLSRSSSLSTPSFSLSTSPSPLHYLYHLVHNRHRSLVDSICTKIIQSKVRSK